MFDRCMDFQFDFYYTTWLTNYQLSGKWQNLKKKHTKINNNEQGAGEKT